MARSGLPPLTAFSSWVAIKSRTLGDDRVENRVGPGDVGRTADGAELKLVAGEGERAGAVAVAGVLGELGQNRDARLKKPPCLVLLAPPFSICSMMSLS